MIRYFAVNHTAIGVFVFVGFKLLSFPCVGFMNHSEGCCSVCLRVKRGIWFSDEWKRCYQEAESAVPECDARQTSVPRVCSYETCQPQECTYFSETFLVVRLISCCCCCYRVHLWAILYQLSVIPRHRFGPLADRACFVNAFRITQYKIKINSSTQ